MSVYAILPVKSLGEVKSRLGASLALTQRAALALQMLSTSVGAVLGSGEIASCAVVSPDADVLSLARSLGAVPLRQTSGGLNEALDQGRGWARQEGADYVLMLLPDLPLLTAPEIADLAELAEGDAVVLAPDRHESGTNGLLVATAAPFSFQFGTASLSRHKQEALRLGLAVQQFFSAGTQFDIDTPLDLVQWRSLTEEARIA